MATVQQAFDLALQHHQAGRLAEAEALYRQILAVQPDYFDALHLLGVIAYQTARYEGAVELIRRAITLNPGNAHAHSNLGGAYRAIGRLSDATAAFHQALALMPDCAEIHDNLGIALADCGRIDEAIAAYRQALALRPDFAGAHNSLGNALTEQDRLDDALAAFRCALESRPEYPEAHNNLGNALKDCGQIDDAVEAYRRALRFRPAYPKAHSNLIYALHFLDGHETPHVLEEQRAWSQRFSDPVKRFIQPHVNEGSPECRLRIGYVSPDFCDHVVGRNLVPLFQCHEQDRYEIVCYSGVGREDNLTKEFRHRAHHWHTTAGMTDEALAEMIRRDAVDILVDLTQHMKGNRLTMFARKPAPVQVSFGGYPESTAVEAIEYRISDRWLESESGDRVECEAGGQDGRPTGEHVFLIDSFWCYDPCGAEVAVNELPAKESEHATFGSLNNFCKVNEPLLRLWARVLKEVPGARLVMLSGLGSHRQRTVEFLEREGVAAERVEFVERCSRGEYLKMYHRLDIVLDTFPYNGHTTSLDALWMGVPVVSLAGETRVSRGGLSVLNNLGLPELVAHSEDEYVDIAARLARDLPRLAELRRTLRPRMEASVLMDAPRFARNIEAAYRAMWRRWCGETSR